MATQFLSGSFQYYSYMYKENIYGCSFVYYIIDRDRGCRIKCDRNICLFLVEVGSSTKMYIDGPPRPATNLTITNRKLNAGCVA